MKTSFLQGELKDDIYKKELENGPKDQFMCVKVTWEMIHVRNYSQFISLSSLFLSLSPISRVSLLYINVLDSLTRIFRCTTSFHKKIEY